MSVVNNDQSGIGSYNSVKRKSVSGRQSIGFEYCNDSMLCHGFLYRRFGTIFKQFLFAKRATRIYLTLIIAVLLLLFVRDEIFKSGSSEDDFIST